MRQTTLCILAAGLTLGSLPLGAMAQSGGPFQEFAGRWSGSGTITHGDGRTERLRCTSNSTARGESLQNQLSCRSDSASFQFVANVQFSGGRVSGQWSETINNVNGSIEGRLNGSSLQGQAQGTGFNASISMNAKGGRQSVAIRSAAKENSTVNITLARAK